MVISIIPGLFIISLILEVIFSPRLEYDEYQERVILYYTINKKNSKNKNKEI